MKTKINEKQITDEVALLTSEDADDFINADKIKALRLEMVSKGLIPAGPLGEIDGLKLLVAYCDKDCADEAPEDMDVFMEHEAAKQGIL